VKILQKYKMLNAANNAETVYVGNHHNVEKNGQIIVGVVMIDIKQKKTQFFITRSKRFFKLS
jgi:hypothetical protein